MRKKIAILHTSTVFMEREPLLFELIEELLPGIERTNIVDDTILAEVISLGSITPPITRRMVHYALAAEAMGVDVIFNTCSSLGPTMDVARSIVDIPIVKIDDGMAEEAAKNGTKIGVLATVPTTLGPTSDLIKEKADSLGTKTETSPALTEGAFEILMRGDVDRHDELVSQEAKEISGWADTLVLAQCSMARLAPRLAEETGLPVLSSPRLGVAQLRETLENNE